MAMHMLHNFWTRMDFTILWEMYTVCVFLQVYIQPGSYSVEAVAEQSNSPSHSQLAWTALDRTYIVHALLVQMIPVPPPTK